MKDVYQRLGFSQPGMYDACPPKHQREQKSPSICSEEFLLLSKMNVAVTIIGHLHIRHKASVITT